MIETYTYDEEISIRNILQFEKIKKKVLKKLQNGNNPNDILIEVYENPHLSRGNKLKIARFLVLKGADRSLMVNNELNYVGGSRFKKYTFKKSRSKSRKSKSRKSKSRKSRKSNL